MVEGGVTCASKSNYELESESDVLLLSQGDLGIIRWKKHWRFISYAV